MSTEASPTPSTASSPSTSPPPSTGKPNLEEDTTSVTCSMVTDESSKSGIGFDDVPTVIDDNAMYLKEELYGRVQKEPELFEWIQNAALDGMW